MDNEEQVFDDDFWLWEYEPYYAQASERSTSKTEFSDEAKIYFCPYLINKSDVYYINWNSEENNYTRLTVTDAQGEVVLQKSYNIPIAEGEGTILDYSRTRRGVLFYSFKAQLPPGDYTATAEFNPNHTVPEALYMNNTKSVDFKVREPQLLGDTDFDSKITILDVTQIQRVLAGSKNPTDVIKKLGDVDQNGDLDVVDATLLQRWLLGLDQELTIGKKV